MRKNRGHRDVIEVVDYLAEKYPNFTKLIDLRDGGGFLKEEKNAYGPEDGVSWMQIVDQALEYIDKVNYSEALRLLYSVPKESGAAYDKAQLVRAEIEDIIIERTYTSLEEYGYSGAIHEADYYLDEFPDLENLRKLRYKLGVARAEEEQELKQKNNK